MNIESQQNNPAMEKSQQPDSSFLPLKKPRNPVRTVISPIWPLTKPITDIKLIFYLLPFLWILGLEQVIPFIIIFVAGAKLFLARNKIRVPFSMRLALIFIFMQLLSATSIDRNSNYVVFAKYFLTYIAGWLLAIILINSTHNIADVRKIIKSIVFMSGWAVLIGILFEVRFLPAEFSSIAGSFLPGALKNSEFVRERILLRQIGITGEVFGPFILNRISSIFLYSTGLALASVATLPLIYYYYLTSRRIIRLFLAILLLLAIVVFLLALARTSILALFFSIALMTGVATIVRFPKLVKPAIIIFALGTIAGLIVISLPALNALYRIIFVNLRAGSLISRF